MRNPTPRGTHAEGLGLQSARHVAEAPNRSRVCNVAFTRRADPIAPSIAPPESPPNVRGCNAALTQEGLRLRTARLNVEDVAQREDCNTAFARRASAHAPPLFSRM